MDAVIAAARAAGGRRDPSGLRLSRREPALRRAGRGRGLHLDRPAARRPSRTWATRSGRGCWPRPRACRCCPGSAALRARGSLGPRGGGASASAIPLLVKAAAGGGGIGMRRVDAAEKLRDGGRVDPDDGRARVRRRHRLSRALHRQGAAHRDPGVRLRRRPRRASVRARLLDPAPLPEDHRGDARRPSSAEETRRAMAAAAVALAAQERYRGAGTIEFVVDAETKRVLLPRDEHAHPGRASGDRDDHRPSTWWRCRSGSPAATTLADLTPGRHPAGGPRDRVPDLRREPRQDVPAVAGAARGASGCRSRATGCGSTRACARAIGSRRTTIR